MYARKEHQLLTCKKLSFRVLRTEEIRRFFRASLAVHIYVMKEGQIQKLFFHVFCHKIVLSILLNNVNFVQLVLYTSHPKEKIPYEMCVPTAFEVNLYFLTIF